MKKALQRCTLLSILMIAATSFSQHNDFLTQVNYKGAFGLSNWAADWSALSHYGIMAPQTTPGADVVSVRDSDIAAGATIYWTADKTYLLEGRVFVDAGAVLNIQAGTVIKGKPGQGKNASALIVARGGKIYAEGTPTRPIIFTAESDDLNNPLVPAANEVGLWGGLIILGKARINQPAGETNIEGIPTTEPRGMYGGQDDDDCSGVLRYVSIRHGGTEIGEGNEINGLTLGGVGRGTVISHVEVWSNKDDGFEWFGGTVNCDHLVAAFCKDDAIDIDEGFRGKLQFIFAIQADSTGDHLGEHDGAPADFVAQEPKAYPVIYNATYLGAGVNGSAGQRIFRLRENFGGEYKNCIFGDYPGNGVTIEDKLEPDARDRLESGELLLQNNIWFNLASNDINVIGEEAWTAAYLADASNGNTVEDPLLNGISRAQDNGLDPRPRTDGPAYKNLAAYPDDDFFVKANYKGAFGS
ncbi:T9SS C-terminal target domain-containing protein, partial [candidate division KSB1 bacterium]